MSDNPTIDIEKYVPPTAAQMRGSRITRMQVRHVGGVVLADAWVRMADSSDYPDRITFACNVVQSELFTVEAANEALLGLCKYLNGATTL